MERRFTVAEAREHLAASRPVLDEAVVVRRELAEHLDDARRAEQGSRPALKAAEAQLSELLDAVVAQGVQIKGYAPLLLDWPLDRAGAVALTGQPDRDVLLCWLENEPELAWWHATDLGFLARRELP